MRAGSLNSRVTIRKRVGTGSLGQPSNTWGDVATVWGDILHLSGSESIKAGAITSTVQASVRIRPRAGIDSSMRLVSGGVTYEIKAVLPNARSGYMDLLCSSTTI